MKTNRRIIAITIISAIIGTGHSLVQAQENELTNDSILSIMGMAGGVSGIYSPNIPNIIPSSPVSRTLQKFLGYPVSHATGTLNVNIPLYELNVNQLSILLDLKCHTSGVKVQDPVGFVGPGWALFPGLKIDRTVMGKPDDIFPVKYIGYPSKEEQIYMAGFSGNGTCETHFGLDEVRIDGQYDLFQLHLPHTTASFILKNENGIVSVENIPDSPVKIIPLIDNAANYLNYRLYAFEVIDEKGIKYLFGESAPVRSTTKYLEVNTGLTYHFATGWVLREIIFPNSEKILFTYQDHRDISNQFGACIAVYDSGESIGVPGCFHSDMINNNTGSNSPYWRFLGGDGYKIDYSPFFHTTAIHSLAPLSIVSADSRIDFAYNEKLLKTITIKGSVGNEIKKISLTHNTINALLTKVEISGEGSYQLKYNEENSNIINSGFDWWGYYNGVTISGTRLPSVDLDIHVTTGYMGQTFRKTLGDGANREPNERYMSARTLCEIIYPTGGNMKLNYEAHHFKVDNRDKIGCGLRIKSIESYDPVAKKTLVKQYIYEDPHFTGRYYPDARSLIKTTRLCALDDGSCMIRQRIISVFSPHDYFTSNATPVWYGKVTEQTESGKSVYIYNFDSDEFDTANRVESSNYSYPELLTSRISRLILRSPWLISETHFKVENGTYIKVESTINSYLKRTFNTVGIMAIPYLFPVGGGSCCQFINPMLNCGTYMYYDMFGSPINYYSYYITTGNNFLTSTEKRTYINNDSIIEKKTYLYDQSVRPYNIIQTNTLMTDGDEMVEKYYYTNSSIPNRDRLTPTQPTQ